MGFYPFVPVASGGGGVTVAGQFLPESYGAAGNGKIFSDAAITATHAILTSPSNSLAGAVPGMTVYVVGAGTAGADLYTTILSVQSSGQVTLNANAGTTVTASGCAFGTDDGAAIKSAHNAAWAYAAANTPNKAQVVFNNKVYVVGAALSWVVGATLEGNALFPFPIVAGSGNGKHVVEYVGLPGDVGALPHWLQVEPQLTGSVVLVLRNDGTNDVTYGPSSVFGGPFNTYGGEPGTYTNLSVTVNGVSVAGPFNPTFGAWDFFGVAQAFAPNGSYMPLGIVPSGGAWPQLLNASISNQYTWGLRMPSAGNNDRCDVGYWSAYGLCYGFGPSEHTTAVSVRCNYCIIGVEGYSGNAVDMAHAGRVIYASTEDCGQAAGFFDGVVKLDIDTLDQESVANYVFETSSKSQGTIQVRGTNGGYISSGVIGGGGGTSGQGLRIIVLDQVSGPVASPQAPPSSTGAWVNGYYWPAWITLSVAGGTITAVTITGQNGTGVAQKISGTPTVYQFWLAPGASYTPTYTGTLSHTVELG